MLLILALAVVLAATEHWLCKAIPAAERGLKFFLNTFIFYTENPGTGGGRGRLWAELGALKKPGTGVYWECTGSFAHGPSAARGLEEAGLRTARGAACRARSPAPFCARRSRAIKAEGSGRAGPVAFWGASGAGVCQALVLIVGWLFQPRVVFSGGVFSIWCIFRTGKGRGYRPSS